jgi:hypothetical protein
VPTKTPILKESEFYGMFLIIMRKMICHRTLLTVMAFLLVGGVVAGAAENEGANHQDEVHHCIACCTNHHAATTTPQVRLQPILPLVSHRVVIHTTLLSQTVLRLPDPPPKLLA